MIRASFVASALFDRAHRSAVSSQGARDPTAAVTTASQWQRLHTAIGNRAVGRLLARAPVRTRVRTDPKPGGPALVPADLVRELKRDNETWTLTIDGDFAEDSLARLMWPDRHLPDGVKITFNVGVTEPIARTWFQLDGITFDMLSTMEPSLAKLFTARGLEREDKESRALQDARAAFRERHDAYSTAVLNNIEAALKRITKRNPELMIVYYRYYAEHELRDESKSGWDPIDFDPDKNAGATVSGDTRINASVLTLSSRFPSDDPVSLLAGTLIHEYVHTSQGGGSDVVSSTPKEAKAYAVELFFSERMGDRSRADVIRSMNWETDNLVVRTGAAKVFSDSYNLMRALYEVIDGGGAPAMRARAFAVEFMSTDSTDFSPELKDFMAKPQ